MMHKIAVLPETSLVMLVQNCECFGLLSHLDILIFP